MRTIAIGAALVDGADRIGEPGRQRNVERAGGQLLDQRGTRLDEHHVELEVLGGVEALLQSDIDRPVGRRHGADQPDRDGVGGRRDGTGNSGAAVSSAPATT